MRSSKHLTDHRTGRTARTLVSGTFTIVGATVLGAVCTAGQTRFPTGLGVPSDTGGRAYAEASRQCQEVRTLTSLLGVKGSADGHWIRARVWVGTAFPALVRLESVASSSASAPFVFSASNDDATLLLHRPDRVVQHERTSAILEALAGIPLSAGDFETVLTGCPRIGGRIQAREFDRTWLKVETSDNDDEVFLRRDSSTGLWRLDAMTHAVRGRALRWRAEFRDRQDGVPRIIRLTSVEWNGQSAASFDLEFSLSRLQINPSLGPETFAPPVPPSARLITLDEARRSPIRTQ